MDTKTYLEQSARTCADINLNFSVFPTAQSVLHQMVEGVQAGMTADTIKRSLFYADPKIAERVGTNTVVLRSLYDAIIANPELKIAKEKVDLLHAALGLMSEAGEIIEEVVSSIVKDRPVDRENLIEEGGDLMWYQALMFRSINSSFEEAGQLNIDKLQKRYPGKFTTEDALARADKIGQEEKATA